MTEDRSRSERSRALAACDERAIIVHYLRKQAESWTKEEPEWARHVAGALRINAEKILLGWHHREPDEQRPDPDAG
jgi:hypothetical protein